jgi:ElaB/YqjD/DUF883 family membrane-anchored ribosome-binding protein
MSLSTHPASSSAEMPSGVPGSVADPAIERVARTAHSAVDRAAGTASSAVERVRSGMHGAMGTMSQRAHDLSTTGEMWTDSARERVREHPLAAVGVALAAGYLLARLMRP